MSFRGDRFGGVVHDLQMYRRGEPVFVPTDNARAGTRATLISTISTLIELVERIDQTEMDASTNPRIGNESGSQSVDWPEWQVPERPQNAKLCLHTSTCMYLLQNGYNVSWCKNCGALKSTYRSDEVQR